MKAADRQQAVHLLFAKMIGNLDELRASGLEIPSEVFLTLGELRGNISGIVEYMATGYEAQIQELMVLADAEWVEPEASEAEPDADPEAEDTADETDDDEEEVLPTRMEQIRRTAGLSPLERRSLHVVQKEPKP